MPRGRAGTLRGAKQHWAGHPDSQAKGNAANAAGKALHRSAEHDSSSQDLLAVGQKMRPSQQESPTVPGQHKTAVARRQGPERGEPQSLRWGGGQSRESSKSRNDLPRSDGAWGAGSAATAFASAATPGRNVGNRRSQATAPAPPHGPDDASDPGSQESLGARRAKGKEKGK